MLYIVSKYGYKEDYVIEFASSVPDSNIVYGSVGDGNDLSLRSIQIIGSKLYGKYCRIASEYEINISSKLRSRMETAFETMYLHQTSASFGRNLSRKFSRRRSLEPAAAIEIKSSSSIKQDEEMISQQIQTILHLFMEANDEIYRLLGYSFSRFKQENEFARLVKHAPQITN